MGGIAPHIAYALAEQRLRTAEAHRRAAECSSGRVDPSARARFRLHARLRGAFMPSRSA
jgi:hypothetical protein